MTAPEENEVFAALVRGRLAVEQYFVEVLQMLGEPTWHELIATNRLVTAAYPTVKWIPFNQNQEGGSRNRTGVGSDWLWWWVSATGMSFGMLVQAKNLIRTGARWSVDFEYHQRRQIIDLLNASDMLNLPAAYVLYCGPRTYRAGLDCGQGHTGDPADRCSRSGVLVLPALIASQISSHAVFDPGQAAIDAYQEAIPLEDLVDPNIGPNLVPDLNLRIVDPALRAFLTQPQTPPLSIAKKVFAMVSRVRSGQFSAATLERHQTDEKEFLFTNLPVDRGHFGVPYYEHVLRGIRRERPQYVRDLLAGAAAPPELSQTLRGMVIVEV